MKRALVTFAILFGQVLGSNVYADTLGRLFFSPEERRQLDNANFGTNESSNSIQSLTVNGIVQKRGGKRTVWINGVAQSAGNSDEHAPTSFPVDVPGARKPVRVKVGQKVTVDSIADSKD